MIEPHHQGLDAWVALHEVVKRPGAVLAAAERHQAVVAIPAAILRHQGIQLLEALLPVDLRFHILRSANVADTLRIQHERFVCFGQQATAAAFESS